MRTRHAASIALAATLIFAPPACSDEDGDGASTDEEVGELDDAVDDAGEDIEREVDAGEEETE